MKENREEPRWHERYILTYIHVRMYIHVCRLTIVRFGSLGVHLSSGLVPLQTTQHLSLHGVEVVGGKGGH